MFETRNSLRFIDWLVGLPVVRGYTTAFLTAASRNHAALSLGVRF
jgi:hypothetical protein